MISKEDVASVSYDKQRTAEMNHVNCAGRKNVSASRNHIMTEVFRLRH